VGLGPPRDLLETTLPEAGKAAEQAAPVKPRKLVGPRKMGRQAGRLGAAEANLGEDAGHEALLGPKVVLGLVVRLAKPVNVPQRGSEAASDC